MRLGKRERAEIRLIRAQQSAFDCARQSIVTIAPCASDGKFASSQSRFFPVLRPVGVPRLNWSLGVQRGKRTNTCPQGWPREPYKD